MGKFIDLTGQRFGRLTVLEYVGYATGAGKGALWKCICDCGTEKTVSAHRLRLGRTKSCGCIRREKALEKLQPINANREKDQRKKSRLYTVWKSMRQRCRNEKNSDYYLYGGRGIGVCQEWEDYSAFYNWAVKNGYRKGLTIDRKNNSGNYEPNNCRWVSWDIQNNNRRSNVKINIGGEEKSVTEWAFESGLPARTVARRLQDGWSIERALTEPIHKENWIAKYKNM